MASLLCSPCSMLSSSAFLSNGPKLGDLKKRRKRSEGKVPWEPISLRCFNGNRERPGRIPLGGTPTCLDALGEQQKEQSNSFLSTHGFQRRQIVLGGFLAALLLPSSSNPAYSLPTGSSDSMTVADAPTAVQVDEINAYSYVYPVGLGQQPSAIRWVESRKPERYSSAAPLSPDARQRIVSERLNIKNNLVVSVSVGPPNFTFLKTTETNAWSAADVARSVLTDKSTARMTTGQRVAEISILDTKSEEKDGVRYWYYEYIVQKSPTVKDRSLDVYRHSVAVTAEREGYLYSLNASASGKKWSLGPERFCRTDGAAIYIAMNIIHQCEDYEFTLPTYPTANNLSGFGKAADSLIHIRQFEPMFKTSVQSFRLESPTTEYVPPYKDPWRFW